MAVVDSWASHIGWYPGPQLLGHRLQLLVAPRAALLLRQSAGADPATKAAIFTQKVPKNLQLSMDFYKVTNQAWQWNSDEVWYGLTKKFHSSKILCAYLRIPRTIRFFWNNELLTIHRIPRLAAVAAARSCRHNEGMQSWSPAHIDVGNSKRSNSASTYVGCQDGWDDRSIWVWWVWKFQMSLKATGWW